MTYGILVFRHVYDRARIIWLEMQDKGMLVRKRDEGRKKGRVVREMLRTSPAFHETRKSRSYRMNGRPAGPDTDKACLFWKKKTGKRGGYGVVSPYWLTTSIRS